MTVRVTVWSEFRQERTDAPVGRIYPDGIHGWIAKVDVPSGGGAMTLDRNFFVDTGAIRPHQIRLEGGDASSDSFCYA